MRRIPYLTLRGFGAALMVALTFALVLPTIASASAEDFVRIENRWKSDQRINNQKGPAVSTPASDNWWSAMWVLEPLKNGRVRIRNRWKGTYLINRNGRGPVEIGEIAEFSPMGWWSIDPVGGGYVHIRSLFNDAKLHVQNGRLEAGGINEGWHSAQWAIKDLNGATLAKYGGSTATTATKKPDLKLKLYQNGVYVANWTVEYTLPGKLAAEALSESGIALGARRTVSIPDAAKGNVRVKATAAAIGNPTIVDRTFSLQGDRCIFLKGTLLNLGWAETAFDKC